MQRTYAACKERMLKQMLAYLLVGILRMGILRMGILCMLGKIHEGVDDG